MDGEEKGNLAMSSCDEMPALWGVKVDGFPPFTSYYLVRMGNHRFSRKEEEDKKTRRLSVPVAGYRDVFSSNFFLFFFSFLNLSPSTLVAASSAVFSEW